MFLKIFPFQQQKKFPSKPESFAYTFVVIPLRLVYCQQLIQIKPTARIPATLMLFLCPLTAPPESKQLDFHSSLRFSKSLNTESRFLAPRTNWKIAIFEVTLSVVIVLSNLLVFLLPRVRHKKVNSVLCFGSRLNILSHGARQLLII